MIFNSRTSLTSFTVLCVGCALFCIPFYPGTASNIIAWLGTDGSSLSHLGGAFFVLLGIYLFFARRHHHIHVTRGKLSYVIEHNVLKGVVEHALSEYFGEGLTATVMLKKSKLIISAEIPKNRTDEDQFLALLTDKLYSLLGYYGEIRLNSLRNL